jgi:hypothetical protein
MACVLPLLLMAWFGCTAVAGSQQYHASSRAALLADAQSSLHVSNAYERKRGFALGAR